MRQISGKEAKLALEKQFHKRGLPKRMRFDNGHPFACTNPRDLPTNIALWLTSLGIEVIFNRPRCPQENGTVECIQRISRRWANPKKCATTKQLQIRLDQVSKDHIELYRIRAKGDKTRKELFPQIMKVKRKYNPNKIQPKLVRAYLATVVCPRKVGGNGTAFFANQVRSIGVKHKRQHVYFRFNTTSDCWEASLQDGTVVYTSPKIILSKKNISNLNLISKN